ncbi:hypothetical protein ASC89_00665 [Devosia sp. Root413D1]|jgi:predicted nucleic acid-binding protein|uniref:PIN domain-containing protein n=1 Tax=unclassified Devosia TaxID=196773 RepID=UPI0006FB9E70|nr:MULTISPECIES: PIN domain-containing protein [unclassified Devosia]KQV09541.1 hypothetical protein ASC68_04410 [Devosia sp. Root105]KQW85628.1 hypothetical protein ASC89_00665 [Devosia sp. Root413D1]
MSADFVDTNILVYFAEDQEARSPIAARILAAGCVASVQVLNEFANVATRRLGYDWARTRETLQLIRSFLDVRSVDLATHEAAIQLAERHAFHVYDATIIASALEAGCTTLYSEDMQHGQLIAGRLRIVNPFR